MKIWGELVPCTYFLGEEGLIDEKKKELWVKVCCDVPHIMKKINEDISFKGTLAHNIYLQLIQELVECPKDIHKAEQ